ncbi:hypothetical protein F4802DRAFT_492990 [Xylaria palmicola]|nr:hypothetical protein F4802DRAFT_492990 [Xylaria palmicola]
MLLSTLTLLASACGAALASPTNLPRAAGLPLPSRTIYQLDDTVPGSWFENIALRSNGDLLVTMLQPFAAVYAIQKPLSGSPKASIINFDNSNGLLGISETSPDVFAVSGGTFSALAVPVEGTMAMWTLDLTGRKPTTQLVTKMPEAVFLNGVITVPGCSTPYVLVADSGLSLVWRVNMKTGKYDVAAEVPEMQSVPTASLPLGVNGVKIRNGYLYFTNSNLAAIYKLAIDKTGVAVKGAKAELVAKLSAPFVDDFDIDAKGNFWVATNMNSTVEYAKPGSTGIIVVGKPTELTVGGDTSLAFGGKTKFDKNIVYTVTGGAQSRPVNGTITEPAKIVAIDRTGF